MHLSLGHGGVIGRHTIQVIRWVTDGGPRERRSRHAGFGAAAPTAEGPGSARARRSGRGDSPTGAASAALTPVWDGSAPLVRGFWLVNAFLMEAIAQDSLGDPAAAGRALESALDAAEADHLRLPFLIFPLPMLLERHATDCARHAPVTAEILGLLPAERGEPPGGPGAHAGMAFLYDREAGGESPPRLADPLSQSEIRVLRYLPTHLSRDEIANELYVSSNTVKTHMRHLYAKLGTHRRAETVERARDLGLLAPAPR